MDHGTPVEHGADPAATYKTRLGLILFFAYATVYGGFIAINTFAPRLMERTVFLGVNLAVTYGFALIVVAILTGLLYNLLANRKERALATGNGGEA